MSIEKNMAGGERNQKQTTFALKLEEKGLPAIPPANTIGQHRVEHDSSQDTGSGVYPSHQQQNNNRHGGGHTQAAGMSFLSEEYIFGGGEATIKDYGGESSEPASPSNNNTNLPSQPQTPNYIVDEEDYDDDYGNGREYHQDGDDEGYQGHEIEYDDPATSSKIPSAPTSHYPQHLDQQQPETHSNSSTPRHKRKPSYFPKFNTIPKLVKMSFAKKPKKNQHLNPQSPHIKPLPTVLPLFQPPSPISHQLPQDYFPSDYIETEGDNDSDIQTTPDLTIDDLYHLVLNMRKGFEEQIEEMAAQIRELKREVRRLKGDEQSVSDIGGNGDDDQDLAELMRPDTVNSLRSITRDMERTGGEGRWFHNES